MTVTVYKVDPRAAYDLICAEHLSILPDIEHETMQRAMMNSAQLWLGQDDEKVLAVWGLIAPTLLSDVAYLWLYTTKNFTSHQFALIRHSQRAVQAMLDDYPVIVGHGKVGADRSLRWLRWLGARFGDPVGEFLPFEIRADKWQQDSVRSA